MRIEKIFCLSLKKDSHRRVNFSDNFQKLNIPIEFHFGVNGNEREVALPSWLSQFGEHNKYNEFIREKIHVLNTELSNSERACVVGHMEIWKKISEFNGNSFFLICEDDAIIHNIKYAKNTIKNLGKVKIGEGLIYFGYTTSNISYNFKNSLKNFCYLCLRFFLKKGSLKRVKINENILGNAYYRIQDNLKYAGQHWGAFGYAITPKIAKELLSLNSKLTMTSDGTIRYARLNELFPMYVISPGIISVDQTMKSNIRSAENQAWCFENFEFG
jgi:GR25 family glycosyltransferase involved in LPS biosynthesis